MRSKLVVLAAIAVAAVVWIALRDGNAPAPAAMKTQAAAAPTAIDVSRARASAAVITPTPQRGPISVGRDAVLVRVNGKPILGRDIVGFDANMAATLTMSQAMYDSLLERAVDRELVLQTARKDGLELDAVRKQQLARVRQDHEARTKDRELVDWEVRDAEGRLVLDMMLARNGATPIPDQSAVDRYYEAHREEFGEMPRADADLDIRQTLSADLAAKYQEAERALLKQLRADAELVTEPR